MSKNAAGKVWFDFFINSLNIDLTEKVKTSESTFKFGGGRILAFLKKNFSVFNEKDDEFLNILEKYSNCWSVWKRFKPTQPKPAVGNLFDPDKMKVNKLVSIGLK